MNTQPSQSSAPTLRVVIAQANLLVGDVKGNAARIVLDAHKARDELRADIVVFPELTLAGYPPEDLLLRPGFCSAVDRALEMLQHAITGVDVVFGYPHRRDDGIFNACAYLRNGEYIARYFKRELPNYGVFDEKRYFVPGRLPCLVDVGGIPVALSVCEDVWVPEPVHQAANLGARLVININASPYHQGKDEERVKVLRARARDNDVPIVYANLVGGQDELVFDGGSMVVAASGEVSFRAPVFEEGLYPCDFRLEPRIEPHFKPPAASLSNEESVYRALVTGIRDYVRKNGFRGAVIGLSGGIDSALTLALAVDAIGPEEVEALLMPSRYTADMSVEDARIEAQTLGVQHYVIPIEKAFETFLESLEEPFAGTRPDTTEENIQARCRGLMLMALSNKRGKIVLTTGNKSEMAVGYATLYGDMAGGFAPLKDVPKTLVYRLARWRNTQAEVIPRRVIERPPSAELAPDQVDEDSLPPYSILDAILEHYVERDQSSEEIVAQGFDQATVERVCAMVIRNEYKRRQAAPGVRITRRAFGRDRRYPITSGYDP